MTAQETLGSPGMATGSAAAGVGGDMPMATKTSGRAWGQGHLSMHYVPVPILAVRSGCSLQDATVGVSWVFLYYFLQRRRIL